MEIHWPFDHHFGDIRHPGAPTAPYHQAVPPPDQVHRQVLTTKPLAFVSTKHDAFFWTSMSRAMVPSMIPTRTSRGRWFLQAWPVWGVCRRLNGRRMTCWTPLASYATSCPWQRWCKSSVRWPRQRKKAIGHETVLSNFQFYSIFF